MEKEIPPPESLTSVNMKAEYAASEVYSSEPPPAYHRPKSAAVQVAKIIAVTVVLVSIVFGGCILASAYINANASCRHLEQELQMLTESMDRYQQFQPIQPEALIQEEPIQKNQNVASENLEAQETKASKDNKITQDIDDSPEQDESSESNSSEDSAEDRVPVQIKLPIQIDFDDLAGAMMEKNQKSKMNCVVEKKRAEEVVDHQPKTVNLPFGLNITTDPRYERISGERIAIFCESGNMQRSEPQDQEETIMIQPVMIPLPPARFNTHMPMQQMPQPPQQMHPLEMMRPPQPSPMMQQTAPTMFQQSAPQMLQRPSPMMVQQTEPQNQLPPIQILHQIAQQIIAQKLQQEAERSQEEVQSNELREEQEQRTPLHRISIQPQMRGLPIPEEVLSQINRMPNGEVIVAVSQQESEEAPQEVRVVQQPRQSAQAVNGRQTYARNFPVNIPEPMMQRMEQVQQEPEAAESEENKQHFVHPRSIRSVDALIPKSQKRVKRCNCDCAC